MAELFRLQADQLQLEHPLPWNVYDAEGHLLLRKGFIIERDAQIENLLERGIFVRTSDMQDQAGEEDIPELKPLVMWESVQAHLAYILEAMPRDGSFSHEVVRLTRQVQQLVDKAPDLAVAAIMLMDQPNYPVAHSMHCAVLAEMVARHAKWDKARRTTLCAAALTMNLGMMELQLQLCNYTGPLNPVQRKQIFEHPSASVMALIQCGVKDDEWLRAVLEHHERLDGQGYPRKVKNPSDLALLLHTVDVFAAKVSPRAHRRPLMPSQATKEVFTRLAQEGDNPFPKMLVSAIGIHPPGAIVRLASGEVGVVYQRGPSPKHSVIAVLLSATGLPLRRPQMRDNATEPDAQVLATLPRDTSLVGLEFEKIWTN